MQQQLVSLRNTATSAAVNAVKAPKTVSGSRSGHNRRRFVLYHAAAAVALTSVAAAKAHQQPQVQQDDQHSALLDAQWVQQIPQEETCLQVLSAKSMETHPLLGKDHIVSQSTLTTALRLTCMHCQMQTFNQYDMQFTAFLRNGQLRDMVCFYDTEEKKYYTVLQLGRYSAVCIVGLGFLAVSPMQAFMHTSEHT